MACPQGKYEYTYQKGMLKVTECLTFQEIDQIVKSKTLSNVVTGRIPQQDDYKGATISADTRTAYQKQKSAELRYQKNKEYAQANDLKFNYQTGEVANKNDKTAQGSNWGTVSAPAIQQTAGSFSGVKDMNTATKGAGAIGGNWLAGASLVPLTMPAAGAIGSEIVNTARAIGPALNIPIRGIPGLTGNNLLWGLGAAYSGNQIIDPNSETRQSINTAIQNPTLGNITDAAGYSLGTGLGFYGLPVRQGLSSLGDDFSRVATPIVNNIWKINPRAYQYNLPKNTMWRGIGQEGAQDAAESGLFRAKQYSPIDYGNISLQELITYPKSFSQSYWSPFFKTADDYGQGYIGEVPRSASQWAKRYGKKEWSQVALTDIPTTEGRILKKDWWSGYKEVPSNFTISRDIAAKFKDLPEGVNSKDLQNIIQKNLDWVKSEEYIQRRIATTGETREQVEKLTNKWISDLQNKTKYSIGSYNDEGGAYLQQFNPIFGRKSYITVNPEITPEKFLDIFEHEFIHGLSPALKSSASSLYKNYPVLNVNAPKTTLSKSLFGKYTDDEKHLRYLAEESEQQARAVRLNNRIRQDLDIKDFRKITESEFDQWLDKFYNPNAKDLANSGFADVVDLLDEAAAASKSTKNRPMLLDWLNKAWAVPGIGGAGILGTGALQQKKQGGQMAMGRKNKTKNLFV
jgi:hypothetical protein